MKNRAYSASFKIINNIFPNKKVNNLSRKLNNNFKIKWNLNKIKIILKILNSKNIIKFHIKIFKINKLIL